jgi:ketopantoate reductase
MALKQIAVMGAGAVGCYYGAVLARSAKDVTLDRRPACTWKP